MDKLGRFFLLCLAGLILLSQPVYSLDWKEKRSDHFFIFYYPGCETSFLERLRSAAESYYRQITDELKFYQHDPWVWEKRAKIYVYQNKRQYVQETGQPEWSAGMAVPARKEIYTYVGSMRIFKGILAHEMTHLMLHEFIGKNADIPLWFDEGLAMYIQYKTMGLTDRIVSTVVRPLIKDENKIPLGGVLTATGYELRKEEITSPNLDSEGISYVDKFYMESFSVVYFLLRNYSRYSLINLCRDVRDGEDFWDSFKHHYYTIRDDRFFERKWREFYTG